MNKNKKNSTSFPGSSLALKESYQDANAKRKA